MSLPPVPPRQPYRLTLNDRRLLKALHIAQDEDTEKPDVLPLNPPQSNPRRHPDDDDGA